MHYIFFPGHCKVISSRSLIVFYGQEEMQYLIEILFIFCYYLNQPQNWDINEPDYFNTLYQMIIFIADELNLYLLIKIVNWAHQYWIGICQWKNFISKFILSICVQLWFTKNEYLFWSYIHCSTQPTNVKYQSMPGYKNIRL